MQRLLAATALGLLTVGTVGTIWVIYLIAKIFEDLGGWIADFIANPGTKGYPFHFVLLDALYEACYVLVYTILLKGVMDWSLKTLGLPWFRPKRQRRVRN